MANATDGCKIIKEGKAVISEPNGAVFYNKVQEFNRDLTIAVVSQYAEEFFRDPRPKRGKKRKAEPDEGDSGDTKSSADVRSTEPAHEILEPGKKYENGIRIFEGLAASGLRSLRFGLEVPGIKEVVANDISKRSVEAIRQNIERNNLEGLVRENHGDASLFMHQCKANGNRFDVIDIDPFGTAAPFLDAAVQAVEEGGLLCVTCTDAPVLCGNTPETCWAKYGSVSLKAKFCHEMALRILLHSIDHAANRYERYIVPVLSFSVDFYIRVFVKVFTGQSQVKLSCTKMAQVYLCVGCGTFELQPLVTKSATKGNNFKFNPATAPVVSPTCQHCGHRKTVGGPIWAEPIHDLDYVQAVVGRVQDSELFTAKHIVGVLSVIKEELQHIPLYYVIDHLCGVLHCTPLSLTQLRSAILNAGYSVSLSHAARNSIKTDAPGHVIWDIMRAWVKQNPVNPDRLGAGTAAKAILDVEPSIEVNFDLRPDANPKSRQQKLSRWPQNPTRDWGPKARSQKAAMALAERRAAKQGKRQGGRREGKGEEEEEEEEEDMETIEVVTQGAKMTEATEVMGDETENKQKA